MINWTDFGKTLSEADAETLRELVDWWRKQRNRGVLSEQEPTPQAPDVYLAISDEQIAGMTAEAGSGSGTDSSVGTNIDKADVRLLRIDDRDPGECDVEAIGVKRTVYNVSTAAIPANIPFLAVRDKPGKFVGVQLGGSGGGFGDYTEARYVPNTINGSATYSQSQAITFTATGTYLINSHIDITGTGFTTFHTSIFVRFGGSATHISFPHDPTGTAGEVYYWNGDNSSAHRVSLSPSFLVDVIALDVGGNAYLTLDIVNQNSNSLECPFIELTALKVSR